MRTGNMGLFIGGVEMSEAFIDLKCNKSCRHIRELEQQKAELIELLTECYKRFKDYEMDVDTDRPIHHIRFMEKLQKYIITGGGR